MTHRNIRSRRERKQWFADGMEISWLDPEHPDQIDLAEAVAVREAVRAADLPERPVTTTSRLLTQLRYGWDADPPRMAVARPEPGAPAIGVLQVHMPRWDNTHLGHVWVGIDPAHRRRGWGRALFEAGVETVRAAGRRVLLSTAPEGGAGAEFLAAMGLTPVFREAYRRLDLTTMDREKCEAAREEAWQRAQDYRLIRMPAPSPEELLPAVATITNAINDAPTGELEIEDELYTVDRIWAYERTQLRDHRLYHLLAVTRDGEEPAGHTVVVVDRERPWYGDQHDTSVARAHRGRRLGLLLKAEMLRWLAEEEPQLRIIDTSNAADNHHMIAINERLGYRLIRYEQDWQRSLT